MSSLAEITVLNIAWISKLYTFF